MAQSDFQFFHGLRVRYSEIDAQGIVFNAHYLTYFDVALTEYTRRFGLHFHVGDNRPPEDFHNVRTVVEYRAPIHFDQEIDIWVRAARIGISSLMFLLEIHPQDEDRLLATGEVIWVNTDQKTRKATPISADFVARLRAAEGDRLVMK